MKDKSITCFYGKYSYLHNQYICGIKYRDITFPSVENAWQASKLHVTDEDSMKKLARMSSYKASKAGDKIEPRKDWSMANIDTLNTFLRQKFAYPFNRERLLSTYDKPNQRWIDIKYEDKKDSFLGIVDGNGANFLGSCLMEIREEIDNSNIEELIKSHLTISEVESLTPRGRYQLLLRLNKAYQQLEGSIYNED